MFLFYLLANFFLRSLSDKFEKIFRSKMFLFPFLLFSGSMKLLSTWSLSFFDNCDNCFKSVCLFEFLPHLESFRKPVFLLCSRKISSDALL